MVKLTQCFILLALGLATANAAAIAKDGEHAEVVRRHEEPDVGHLLTLPGEKVLVGKRQMGGDDGPSPDMPDFDPAPSGSGGARGGDKGPHDRLRRRNVQDDAAFAAGTGGTPHGGGSGSDLTPDQVVDPTQPPLRRRNVQDDANFKSGAGGTPHGGGSGSDSDPDHVVDPTKPPLRRRNVQDDAAFKSGAGGTPHGGGSGSDSDPDHVVDPTKPPLRRRNVQDDAAFAAGAGGTPHGGGSGSDLTPDQVVGQAQTQTDPAGGESDDDPQASDASSRLLSAALAQADELAAEEVQTNTRDQGHCDLASSTCQQGVCKLNTPGCTAYTDAEKQQMQTYYSAMFVKILLSGKCTPASREGDATCSKYGYCDLVNADGERSNGCEPMSQAEHQQLLTTVQQMGDVDPSVLFPSSSPSPSTPAAGAGAKAKRDVSSTVGSSDKAAAFEQFVNAEAAKIADLAVEQSAQNQGMCQGDTEACHAGFCQLSAPHCRPIDAETKAAMREYWTDIIAQVLTTGKCQSASQQGCSADGYCDLMTREGERNRDCAELSLAQRQKLIESLEYHQVDSSTAAGSEHTDASKSEHPTVAEPGEGAKVKRDLSRGSAASFDHTGDHNPGHLKRSTTSDTSDSVPVYTTETFNPRESELPHQKVSRQELREYMELCQQLAQDSSALQSVANAAGVYDQAEIATLADRFAELAKDEHAAKMALVHAKEAQMLAESKLPDEELSDEKQDSKQ